MNTGTKPVSHKPRLSRRPTYVATLTCGHKRLVTDPAAAAVCPTCGREGAPVTAHLFRAEKFKKWVPQKESEA